MKEHKSWTDLQLCRILRYVSLKVMLAKGNKTLLSKNTECLGYITDIEPLKIVVVPNWKPYITVH